MKSPRFRAGGFLCPFVRGGFVRVPAVLPIHWGLLSIFVHSGSVRVSTAQFMRRGFLWAFVRGGFPAALPRRTCSVLEARPQRTGNFSAMERILPEVYFRKSG